MRIRYLSLSTAKYSTNYFPFLSRYARAVASPGTEIDLVGARVGRIDSYRFWELLDTVSILDAILDAEATGFDAVAIGNILDPGLREARAMVDIPVLGIGETSMLTACTMGNRFALIGVNPHFSPRFVENVAKYGLERRLAAIESMDVSPHELDACFAEGGDRARAIESFARAARTAIAAGAEVIVPAGGRLTAFLNAQSIREIDGVCILDGTAVLITMTEAAVRLRSVTGMTVSRHGLYARAPRQLIETAATEYAEGYNIPALARWSAGVGHAASAASPQPSPMIDNR